MATPKKTSGFDPFKNSFITWVEHDTWLDGSPLSDSKNAEVFNDVLFKRKVINKKPYFFKRQVEFKPEQPGAEYFYNVQDFGVMPGEDAGENFKRLQYGLIDYLPQGYSLPLYFPEGRYEIDPTVEGKQGEGKEIGLKFDGKPPHIKGVAGISAGVGERLGGTRLIFPEGSTGIYFLRESSNHAGANIENIAIEATGSKSIPWCSGINARAKINCYNVFTKGFSHNGIDLWGTTPGTDVSHSKIRDCESAENGNDGFFAGRTDGNMVIFDGCDARDNGRYGFNDDSFLGNRYRDCMAHYNGRGKSEFEGCDYFVRDWENGRAIFEGCYSESGNTNASLFSNKTRVIGGFDNYGTGYRILAGPVQYGSFEPTQ